jgi:hypothetical protein
VGEERLDGQIQAVGAALGPLGDWELIKKLVQMGIPAVVDGNWPAENQEAEVVVNYLAGIRMVGLEVLVDYHGRRAPPVLRFTYIGFKANIPKLNKQTWRKRLAWGRACGHWDIIIAIFILLNFCARGRSCRHDYIIV